MRLKERFLHGQIAASCQRRTPCHAWPPENQRRTNIAVTNMELKLWLCHALDARRKYCIACPMCVCVFIHLCVNIGNYRYWYIRMCIHCIWHIRLWKIYLDMSWICHLGMPLNPHKICLTETSACGHPGNDLHWPRPFQRLIYRERYRYRSR